MVSVETFRALASIYAAFSLFGSLVSFVSACYYFYALGKGQQRNAPLDRYVVTGIDPDSLPSSVERTIDGYGNAFYLMFWSIMNFVFDAILIKGITQMNALYVQIRRIFFILTNGLALVVLLLLGAVLLLFGNHIEDMLKEKPDLLKGTQDENMQMFLKIIAFVLFAGLVVAILIVAIIYWILTGLLRGIREQEQRGRTAGTEMFQLNLATANNCNSLGPMKNQNNEFDV